MILLNPPAVRFGDLLWTDVALVAVDRAAHRQAVEWTDAGPHAAFADVPEQRTTVRIVRTPGRDDLASPAPGEAAALEFFASPTASDGARRRIRAPAAVLLSVAHELPAGGKAPRQTLTLIALSPDGAADPFIIDDAAPGAFP